MRALIAVLGLLLAQGAAAEKFWQVDMPGYSAPVRTVRMRSAEELSAKCGHWRPDDGGCAIRRTDVCEVWLGPRADACVQSHEENGHCGKDGRGGKSHVLTYGFVQECAYPDQELQ